MIVAVSTSSPRVSVALISPQGEVLSAAERDAPQAASGAVIELLQHALVSAGRELEDATLFVADLGPGSFTGTRVGVTVAKMLGFARAKPVAGLSSFDLISTTEPVVVPSKKGEYFVRHPSGEVLRLDHLPMETFVGYGRDVPSPRFPSASAFATELERLAPLEPERLLPNYVNEPSISKPNRPYGLEGRRG